MSSHLKQVFDDNHAALSGASADQATVRFAADSSGLQDLHRRVRIRDFAVEVDEPAALGGTDRAPNPVEYALAALASCQEITYRLHAEALGIPLRDVSVKLEGSLDLRGFFAAEPSVRPGFQQIRGTVTFDSPASPEALRRLKEVVDAHCPVLDLFRNPTPVALEVAEQAGAPQSITLAA